MSKKKVLILVYNMVPYAESWGGCQRMYYLANGLVDNGYDVAVFAKKNRDDIESYNKSIRFKTVFGKLNKQGKKKECEVNCVDVVKKTAFSKVLRSLYHSLDRFLFNEPSPGLGFKVFFWGVNVKDELVRCIKNSGIEILIVSAPPFEVMRLGLMIKRLYPEVILIYDYRDPWNAWNDLKGISLMKEKACLRRADSVVVTTESLKSKMLLSYGVKKTLLHVISNGYSSELWSEIDRQANANPYHDADGIKIAYVGNYSFSSNSYRNPIELFKAIKSLRDFYPIVLYMVGPVKLDLVYKYQPLYPFVKFVGEVDVKKSLLYIKYSDVLIGMNSLQDNASKYVMAGKVYDYVRSGKPFLLISNLGSYERDYLSDYPMCYFSCNSAKEIEAQVREIISYACADEIVDSPRFGPMNYAVSRESQIERYIELIKSL